MKIIECEQGGQAWFAARLGRPTASCFHRFLTGTGTPRRGEMPRTYALELVGERLTRLPADHFVGRAAERGTELEPRARAYYELVTGRTVKQVGFCLSDCGRWGASPDGLCADRGIEIKCPLTPAFLDIAEARMLPPEHALQVQAGMWITGLLRWDYVLWTDVPGLEPQIIECAADDKMHAAFEESVPAFADYLDALESKLRSRGHGQLPDPDAGLPTWDQLTGERTVG